MFYSYPQETFQEVPGEISLALSISGCPINCIGCHSSETHNKEFGKVLDETEMKRLLKKHKHISTVLFYGGEWLLSELKMLMEMVINKGLKVALYSGFELSYFNEDLLEMVDFIKVGRYKEDLGGLQSPNTNQRFYKSDNGILEEIKFY